MKKKKESLDEFEEKKKESLYEWFESIEKKEKFNYQIGPKEYEFNIKADSKELAKETNFLNDLILLFANKKEKSLIENAYNNIHSGISNAIIKKDTKKLYEITQILEKFDKNFTHSPFETLGIEGKKNKT